jgi:hypothetical protein
MSGFWCTLATITILATWAVVMIAIGVYDLVLGWTDAPTLSDKVWDGNNLLGVAIVLLSFLGGTYLIGHFWLGWFRPSDTYDLSRGAMSEAGVPGSGVRPGLSREPSEVHCAEGHLGGP